MSASFLNYIHNFRAVAIIYIVAGHCIYLFDWQKSPQAERWLRAILQNGTVFFVFVAGFLFQHLSQNYNFKEYMRKKALKVILPYLIISLPVIVYYIFIRRGGIDYPPSIPYRGAFLQKAIWLYATGHHLAAYWFIPMITIFYLLSPLLIRLDNSRFGYWPLPLLLTMSVFVHRPMDNLNVFHNFIYYFSAYFSGMGLSHYKSAVIPKLVRLLPLLGLFSLALIIIEAVFSKCPGNIHTLKMFGTENGLLDLNFMQKMLLCGFFVGFLHKYDFNNKWLSFIANASFGIYFIHIYAIFIIIKLANKFSYAINGSLLYLSIATSIITMISMAAVIAVRKATGKTSRYLIGS